MSRNLCLVWALLVLVPGCSEDGDGRRRNTYHFLAHLDEADLGLSDSNAQRLALLQHRPPRTADDRLSFAAVPGVPLRFEGVALGRGATLHATFGLQPGSSVPSAAPRFVIDLMLGAERHTLLDQLLSPAGREPGALEELSVALPELPQTSADFVFLVEAEQGADVGQPIWCDLRLERLLPDDRATVATMRRADLLLDAPLAGPTRQAGSALRAASSDRISGFGRSEDGGLLLQEAPATSAYEVDLESGGRISFGLASYCVGEAPGSDLVTTVRVDGQQVFEHVMGADAAQLTRRFDVPLPEGSSGPAVIELSSRLQGARPSEEAVVTVLWVSPMLEQWELVPRQSTDKGPNVLLVTVDTLRADHLSCYGYSRETSPRLDALANDGVVFEQAMAPSSWTVPSTGTLLTGLYSYTHGLYDETHWYLLPGVTTLAESFRQAGISTVSAIANPLVNRENESTAGFESLLFLPDNQAAQVNRAFLSWLDEHPGERFFAYVHYMDPHEPYASPGESYRAFGAPEGDAVARSKALKDELQRLMEAKNGGIRSIHDLDDDYRAMLDELVDLYDAEIAYWDEQFGRLLDALRQRDLLEDTIIVVTSDHGEEFADHGMLEHGRTLHREVLHVPMVIAHSGQPAGRRRGLVGLIDLAPTLIDLAGLAPPEAGPPFAGSNLFGLRSGAMPLFAETSHAERVPGVGWHVELAALSGRWKGVLAVDDGSLRVFERLAGGAERELAADAIPDGVRDGLALLLDEWVGRCKQASPSGVSLHNEGAVDLLEQIGYLR